MISSSITHIVFTEAEKKVFTRGVRFCLPPKEVDAYDVKCSFELLFRDLNRNGPFFSTKDQDSLKSGHKNISYNYTTHTISPQRSIYSIRWVGSPKDLHKDDSIIITKPDKGNCVVIVNKLDYLNKMKQLISDQTKFKKLPHSLTKSREDRTILLMMPHSKRYYFLLLILVFSTVFPSYINLDALFAVLFPLLTLTTTITLLILFVDLSMSPPTSLLSRTLLVLLNGLWHTATTTSSCALLMFLHCSPMFHLMRQLKLVKTNYMPRLIRLSYPALFLMISLFLLPRYVILCLITSWRRCNGISFGSSSCKH